jgi:predicted DNA-binding transcriptional regulator AlpA
MSSIPAPQQLRLKEKLKSSTPAIRQPTASVPASPLQHQLQRERQEQDAKQQLKKSAPETHPSTILTPLSPHQPQGDRGGDSPAALDVYVRFADLQKAGLVKSWPVLLDWIARRDFPPGISISRRTRIWPLSEVQAWLDSQPRAA